MYTVAIIAMAAVLGAIECAVFPASKCNTRRIEPVSLDFHKMAGYGKHNIIYGPEVEGIDKVDHSDMVYTRKDDSTYTCVNTRYFKDKTTDKQSHTHSFVDNVILEDGIDAGKPYHFHIYPLATTKEDAILFYRCSDAGREAVDTRYITIPAGKTLSDESLKELLAVDKKYNFRGNFYKFPYQLP